MKGKATDVNANMSRRPGGATAGPEDGASLKSGLAARAQIKSGHGSLGMDEGEGSRPSGWKGSTVTGPKGKKFTWA